VHSIARQADIAELGQSRGESFVVEVGLPYEFADRTSTRSSYSELRQAGEQLSFANQDLTSGLARADDRGLPDSAAFPGRPALPTLRGARRRTRGPAATFRTMNGKPFAVSTQ
jgi:hypothetical protein